MNLGSSGNVEERYQASTLNIVKMIRGDEKGGEQPVSDLFSFLAITSTHNHRTTVKYEQDGRWMFRAQDNLPPVPPYENVDKEYCGKRGTFINWEGRIKVDQILEE